MSEVFTYKADFSKLNAMLKKYDGDAQAALEKVALQMLTWFNNGSPKESAKPPIRFGVLRGSSSAFVGGKHVGDFAQAISPEAEEQPTPNQSYAGDKKSIVLGWNTDYASKMHEWQGGWGEFTQQDGDAGAKWAEKHVAADGDLSAYMLADELGKKTGMK